MSPSNNTTIDVIILARHGKPALSRDVYLTWRGFRDWWQQYDEGGLALSQKMRPKTAAMCKSADIVISSSLRRALETARMARGGIDPDKILPVLIEADLPSPNLGPLKLKPRLWGVLSRIVWFFGFSGGMESVSQARARALVAANILQEEAAGGKQVFVTAHGWFNRMIGTKLMRQGWKRTENQGDLHWQYRRYERASQ